MAKKVLEVLTGKFGDAIPRTASEHGDEVAWVKRDRLLEVARFLRDDPGMAFDAPVFVTCIDLLGLDTTGAAPRFELVYQLRSSRHRHRIRLKVSLAEEDLKAPSLSGLWVGFEWQERETYDMYGVVFENHPDLRRIYMYEEFVGYPLRKDYPKEKRQPLVRRDFTS
jgi:NADH-quinone oxidoreductase subunit C